MRLNAKKTIIDDDGGISIQAETEENESEQVARKCRYSKHRQGKKKRPTRGTDIEGKTYVNE